MQTVNFQCGHCGKLMGVGSDHLGQQVRCPHCQQVVIAPPPATEPPPPTESSPAPEAAPLPELVETIPHSPPADDAADIFAPAEASDDLFGHSEPPRIEMPPDSFAPILPPEDAALSPEAAAEPALTAAFPFLPPTTDSPPPADGDNTAVLPPADGVSPWLAGPVTETFAPLPMEEPTALQPESLAEAAVPVAPRPARRREQGAPWFTILVFSPLLLYAIVITVFAVLVYRHEQELEQRLRNPFEKLPDAGDNPGVQKGKKTTWLDNPGIQKLATLPLPAPLCTTLEPKGQSEPIRIGDLQITPRRVERQRVRVVTENFESRPEPQLADSLVLYLALKNLSSEYAFAPLDNYFDRKWQPGPTAPPLTQLEVGDKYRFYGGPAQWYPRGSKGELRQWLEKRPGFEADLLQPGEEKEFFVCTDGGDAAGVLALFGANDEGGSLAYHGQFLWRIRVRRGLVRIKDKQYSATAVVGVHFTDKDIKLPDRDIR